jgi:hypothetical protein
LKEKDPLSGEGLGLLGVKDIVPFRGFEHLERKRPSLWRGSWIAGGKGFEPLQTDPESVVLPLDEPPPYQRAVFYHAGGISV